MSRPRFRAVLAAAGFLFVPAFIAMGLPAIAVSYVVVAAGVVVLDRVSLGPSRTFTQWTEDDL